jgi:hypothetical protein
MRTRNHASGITHITYCFAVCLLLLAGCYDPSRENRFFPQAPALSHEGQPMELDTIPMTNAIGGELLHPGTEPYRLGPGDRVEVELIGDPTSRTLTTVGPDGRIYFHLPPGIDVWGRTLPEARAAMEQALAEYIIDEKQRQISISLRGVESRRVWLLGRFQAPGVYPISSTMTLLEAISLAGGPASLSGNQQSNFAYSSEDLADLRRAFLCGGASSSRWIFTGFSSREIFRRIFTWNRMISFTSRPRQGARCTCSARWALLAPFLITTK